jgi:hypothetical protein
MNTLFFSLWALFLLNPVDGYDTSSLTDSFIPKNSPTIIEAIEEVVKIYSNDNKAKCLEQYLTAQKNKNIDVIRECPEMFEKVPNDLISEIPKNGESLGKFLLVQTFLQNPDPIIRYLINGKKDPFHFYNSEIGTTFDSYSYAEEYFDDPVDMYTFLYLFFVLSQAVKDPDQYGEGGLIGFLDNEIYLERENSKKEGYILTPNFTLKVMSVEENRDFVLLTDLFNSGAYNYFYTLYEVEFLENNIQISLAKVMDTQNGNIRQIDQENDSIFFANSFFDYKTKTFQTTGMLPFGLYACSRVYIHSYCKGRFFLTSIEEPKECITYPVDDIDDFFPENADMTPIEVYSWSLEEKCNESLLFDD